MGNELASLLVDEAGNKREWNEFKREASAIDESYNKNWLKTEFNLAGANGQMASRWVAIQKDKDILPFLKYRTVGDDHVRLEHASMEGITLRIDHIFWTTHYPPNEFGCRCDVDQLEDAKETNMSKRALPEIPKAFQNNVGITGEAFTKEHPYFNVEDKKTAKQLTALGKKIADADTETE